MASSPTEAAAPRAQGVRCEGESLVVELLDGRSVSVPLAWYPRLAHGSQAERTEWRLIGRGHGIHWPALDEDIAVDDLLAGRRSAESQPSSVSASSRGSESPVPTASGSSVNSSGRSRSRMSLKPTVYRRSPPVSASLRGRPPPGACAGPQRSPAPCCVGCRRPRRPRSTPWPGNGDARWAVRCCWRSRFRVC